MGVRAYQGDVSELDDERRLPQVSTARRTRAWTDRPTSVAGTAALNGHRCRGTGLLVFRSIPVLLKAAAGFLLTIAASLGAVGWIFQQGNLADVLAASATGPIVSFLPILMIAILFGLAMDYEVFLVSRMRGSYLHTEGEKLLHEFEPPAPAEAEHPPAPVADR